jgi:hypothetical protein
MATIPNDCHSTAAAEHARGTARRSVEEAAEQARRDLVRSQRSEKTDAVRVCRKTGGRELCLERERDDTRIATKCYCLLT